MAAVKKKAAKKKAAKKKVVDNSQLESKLGHDPLAWLSGDEEHVVSDSNIVVEPETVAQTEVEEKIVNEAVEIQVETEESLLESTVQAETETVSSEQPAETGNKKDETMLNLPDVFGIAQAEIMYQEIKDLLSSTDEIKIDGSAVEMIDASALQLLIVFVNECKSQGKKVSWSEKSDKINDSAKLLNLTESLGI
jgi:ABC-type transporter Mla MlaB component